MCNKHSCITLGINIATEFSHDSKVENRLSLPLKANDTLEIKFVNNEFYSKDIEDNCNFKLIQDSTKHEILYSNNVKIHLKYTEKENPYVVVEKEASGKSFDEANDRAEKINYTFKLVGNQLLLNNFFTTDAKSKFRNQKVNIYVYMPKGLIYYPNKNVERYLSGHDADFDYFYGPEGYHYLVNENKMKCLDCPDDDDDDEIEDVNVEIDGNLKVETKKKENDSIEKVSIKINGKDIINTEVKKSN